MATLIFPSGSWNGTAGSGGGYPADPTRTTAKPFLNFLIPPNQHFNDDLVIGVHSYAEGGVAGVKAYIEGNSFDLTFGKHEYTDVNGVARTLWGYFATLDHSAFPMDGSVNVVFEATANDETMQKRVLPAMAYARRSGSLYDGELELAATPAEIVGSRYRTLAACFAYAKAQSWNNWHVTCSETGTYDFGSTSAAPTATGYVTIDAGEAVTLTLARSSWANANPGWDGVRFAGDNVLIDIKNVYGFQVAASHKPMWFDGCDIYSSDGRYALRNGLATELIAVTTLDYIVTEAHMHDVIHAIVTGPALVRHSRVSTISGDATQRALNVYGLDINDIDAAPWRTPENALTISYSGSGTGTVEKTLGNGSLSGTIVLRAAGAVVQTVNLADPLPPIGNPLTIGVTKSVQDIADEINAQTGTTGFSATWISDKWTAPHLTGASITGFGAMPQADCKTAPLTLVTAVDVHADVSQPNVGGTVENVAVVNIKATDLEEVQVVWNGGGGGYKDAFFINWGADNPAGQDSQSTFGGNVNSHLCLWNLTVPKQQLRLSTVLNATFDDYCSVRGNVFDVIWWVAGATPSGDLVIDQNHMFKSSVAAGTIASGTNMTTGGTVDGLIADSVAGDFTPVAESILATQTMTSVVGFDLNGEARGETDVRGTVALNTTPPSVPDHFTGIQPTPVLAKGWDFTVALKDADGNPAPAPADISGHYIITLKEPA